MNQKQKNKIAKQNLFQKKLWKLGFLFLFSATITGKKATYIKVKPAFFTNEKKILENSCLSAAGREYLIAWALQNESPIKTVLALKNAKELLSACNEISSEKNELKKRISNLEAQYTFTNF